MVLNEDLEQCWRLDGTDGLQCETCRKGHTVKKPKLAKEARGERHTRRGVRNGKPFYHCTPALEYKAGIITREEMMREQLMCDKYMRRP